MIDLRRQFQAAFFDAWQQAGLPDPAAHDEAYVARRNSHRCPFEANEGATVPQHPLNPELLDAVYGFGVVIGECCGTLLGIPTRSARARAKWCGRFNLGISLFDYCCDRNGGFSALPHLSAFRPFWPEPSAETAPAFTPVELFLNRVASSVLSDLAKEIRPPSIATRPSGLWKTLGDMLRAELFAANASLAAPVDVCTAHKALRLKSAEPFRVMVEWLVGCRMAQQCPSKVRAATTLGRAVGDCFWLVDDARDVWEDLDAGHWNFFLLSAAEANPDLFARPRDAFMDVQLCEIWRHTEVAQRTAQTCVQNLAKTLHHLRPAQNATPAIGLLAASLERWCR